MANTTELFSAGFAQASAARQSPSQAQVEAMERCFWVSLGNPDLSGMTSTEKMGTGFKLDAYKRTMQQHADRIRNAPLPLSVLSELGLTSAEAEVVKELAGLSPA